MLGLRVIEAALINYGNDVEARGRKFELILCETMTGKCDLSSIPERVEIDLP